ncbi:DDB1- and CUL4-associated factor 10 [Paramecium bursaria]
MNTNNRFCIYLGHDQYAATHLCIFKDCKLQQRWCCVQCITEGVHNHSQQGFTHLIPWKDVILKKKEELLKLQQDQQIGLQQFLELLKFIKEYQSFIEQQIKKIQKIKEDLQHFINDLSEQKFIQLNNNRLDEVICMNKSQLFNDQVLQIKSYQNIEQKLRSIIKDFQDYRIQFHQIIDLKQVKYKIKQIVEFDKFECMASQISNNQTYLAYSIRKLLQIYDIQKDSVIREITLDDSILVIEFTYDSNYLYVGCENGYVFGFDFLNDFKQIFGLQLHQDCVADIRIIQNEYLITCSHDKTIIKTDIRSKQQLFKLIGHTQEIYAIDYNEINDILISGSEDRKQKHINKLRIITSESGMDQIQLINNFQNVLSLDLHGNLYKWKIDLIQKQLIKIQEFQDPNKIFNFYQINQNQNLILICKGYIKILNDQAETINQIDHQAGDFDQYGLGECRQVDDGKLIQIRSKEKIMLAIAQI